MSSRNKMGRNPFSPSSAPMQLDLPVIGTSRRIPPAVQRTKKVQTAVEDRSLIETVVTRGIRLSHLAGQMARTLFGHSRR